MSGPRVLLAVGLVATGCGGGNSPPPSAQRPATTLVDHHVHLLGPQLIADWKSLGVPFSRPDSAYLSADAVLRGPSPVLQSAVLVPMAHLYGQEEFRTALGISLEEEQARTRVENDHVAAHAARWPGRAVAFCAVSHRRPYAAAEMERCRRELRSSGLKLHLAAAGVDLTDLGQLEELERIADWAEQHRMTLLLHFDTQRRGLEVADVERFLVRVLEPHPALEVILAHLGGSGGYGGWTRSVLGAFGRWIGDHPGHIVWLELSAVLLAQESEGVPASTPEEALALGEDMRRIGLDRFVFGTDYPVFQPAAYAELLGTHTGLTAEELGPVLARRATVLTPLR